MGVRKRFPFKFALVWLHLANFFHEAIPRVTFVYGGGIDQLQNNQLDQIESEPN